jgi:hypothetical protein
LEDEAFQNRQSGYSIRYPMGWENLVYEEVGADIFYDPAEPIAEVMDGVILPEIPIVAITGGTLDVAFDGQVEGTENAREVLDILISWVSDYDNFETGEVETAAEDEQTVAAVDVAWSQDDMAAAGRYIVLHMGDRILAIQTLGTVEGWDDFVPTFESMLDSITVFELETELGGVTQEYEGEYYTIRYPSGWEAYSQEGTIFFFESEDVFDEEVPSVPVIVIEAGPLDKLADGHAAGAHIAEEMLEAVGDAQRARGKEFEMGQVDTFEVAGEPAAGVDVRWMEGETEVVDLAIAIHMGDWGILIQAVSTEEGWASYIDTFQEMVESLTIIEVEDDPEMAGEVDFTDPASVLQAVFAAAQTQDFSALSRLCDPLGDHDGDTQLICEITDDHPDKDAFVSYFAKAKIAGEPIIQGDEAHIPFTFGPNGDEEETMVLIQRDGKWYLLSF